MLIGRVEDLTNCTLTGWAFNKQAPGEHLIVRVNHGTQIVATGIANILRPDLPKSGIGAGDHAFKIDLPPHITSISGLMVIAQSQKHGEIALPIATSDERTMDAIFNAFAKRYDSALLLLKQEMENLKESVDERGAPGEQGDMSIPEDLAQRLVRLENRMESAEVFFVRIDEMMRQLVAEKKKRRKRFLGIF